MHKFEHARHKRLMKAIHSLEYIEAPREPHEEKFVVSPVCSALFRDGFNPAVRQVLSAILVDYIHLRV
jgi:hypothetical protein